jgi:GNAT superfamily N-acetyltransferase
MEDKEKRIRDLVRARRWPDELADEIVGTGISFSELRHWQWEALPAEVVPLQLEWYRRFRSGDLRGRIATLADNDAIADLFDRSHEELGEWMVFTERSPNAFAQFYLQRTSQLFLISDSERLIACVARARRNVEVGGRRISVNYSEAMRVDPEFRRHGYGDQVRRLPSPIGTLPVEFTYDYIRTENDAIANWTKKYHEYVEGDDWQGSGLDVPVTVTEIPAREAASDTKAIRNTRREDLDVCAALINATHRGQDLFRPYTAEYLEDVLDEGFWGEAAVRSSFESIYGWTDHFVLEHRGRIVACAGLWDRGRNQRARWQRKGESGTRTVTDTSVLDFGYVEGEEAAMETLLLYLLNRTHELERDQMVVPMDQLPALETVMENYRGNPETRKLRYAHPQIRVERPFTDLRFW